MKVAAALLLLAATFLTAADAADPSSLEEYLTASLLRLKKEMPAGIPDLDIPPMDPHALPDIEKKLVNHLATLDFVLKDVTAEGLSTFDPRAVVVTDDQLQIRLAFPSIGFSGNYEMSGSILGFPVVGAGGSADVAVMDIGAVCTAILNTTEAGVAYLYGVQTHISVGSSLLMLQRFPSVDEIVKEVMKRLADGILARYQPVLEADLNDALTKGLNAALAVRGSPASEALAREIPAVRVFEAGNANGFIDHMISEARPTLANKDPLILPEARKGFEKIVLGARIHGEAKIYDGFLAGIQTIHRTGDAEMTQPDATHLVISAHMGMSNLHGHYRMHAKFMNIGPSGEISVKVTMVSCELRVSVDMSSGKPKATLEHFDINYIGKVEIHFDGLGPLDWLINPLGGWIINLVKHKIADAVEGPLKKLIQSKMENVDIPIGY